MPSAHLGSSACIDLGNCGLPWVSAGLYALAADLRSKNHSIRLPHPDPADVSLPNDVTPSFIITRTLIANRKPVRFSFNP